MSGLSKKVKAFHPLSRYPKVGQRDAGDRKYLQGGKMTMVAQQKYVGPGSWIFLSFDLLVNPGQSFLGQVAEKCQK